MSGWRGLTRPALDAAYNNSAAVADSADIVAGWDARGARLRGAAPCQLDLRYGPEPRNRIDWFAGRDGGPLCVFIHGGYWQMRAKETFAFLAAGLIAHGVHVALVGYTLAPRKRLTDIVAETRAALAWIAARAEGYGADPRALVVSGWSAGGHLAAICLTEPGVAGGLAVSGIYDLEPIRACYLNEALGLDAAEAAAMSPLAHLPRRSPPLVVAHGGAELPELQRQSREYAAARAAAGLPGRLLGLAGHNHFTILEELASPDGRLTREVLALLGGG